MTILLALNLLFYNISKLGTFEQLEQGHDIEKLYVIANLKLLRKCFHNLTDFHNNKLLDIYNRPNS